MRPGTSKEEVELFECQDCGARAESPETRLCTCGGELINLSKSRDL